MYISKPDNQDTLTNLSVANGDESAQTILGKVNQEALAKTEEGKYAEAEILYKEAIAIGGGDPSSPQSEISLSFYRLAELYIGQGKFIQSESFSKRALKIREDTLGPDHPDVAASLKQYAKILRQKKFNFKAAQLEARAKNILKKQK
jgi:tetratricopeptide (TPR) repeat protein